MEGIKRSDVLELQVVITGMHLTPEFGSTLSAIEDDGFGIDKKVEMLLRSDTAVGITKSMGLGMIGFADAFADLRPDLILMLGDRFEIFCAATAAMVARIPVAHLHGGEITEGLIDDSIRHSISKMSHLHFVATEEYRKRVMQLGENPENIFNVGGLGLDNIKKLSLLSRDELERDLGINLLARNLLITFHPVTLEDNAGLEQLDELLTTLDEMEDTGLIFTMPNADPGNQAIRDSISLFCENHVNASLFISLGQLRYLSCMSHVDGVIGNSSSGLIEAPGLKKGSVNIGNRQRGRNHASSVIDCEASDAAIRESLARLFSRDFQRQLQDVVNPYGDGGASEAIVRLLEKHPLDNLLKKQFYDVMIP